MCDSDLIPLQVPRARTLKGGWYDGRNELTHNRFTEGVVCLPSRQLQRAKWVLDGCARVSRTRRQRRLV